MTDAQLAAIAVEVWRGDTWRTTPTPALVETLPDNAALCHTRRDLGQLRARLMAKMSDTRWRDTRALRLRVGIDIHDTVAVLRSLLDTHRVERRRVASRSGRGSRFVYRRTVAA